MTQAPCGVGQFENADACRQLESLVTPQKCRLGKATVQFVRETEEAHSNELRRGVCHGMGLFIATGGSDLRRVWTSPDGQTWTLNEQGQGWAADCAVSPDRIVAAGGSHTLSTSTDGTNWTVTPEFGNHYRGVAYGDGVWVASGDDGVATPGASGVRSSADMVPCLPGGQQSRETSVARETRWIRQLSRCGPRSNWLHAPDRS